MNIGYIISNYKIIEKINNKNYKVKTNENKIYNCYIIDLNKYNKNEIYQIVYYYLTLKEINSKYIVKYVDLFEYDRTYFVITEEYNNYITLLDMIQNKEKNNISIYPLIIKQLIAGIQDLYNNNFFNVLLSINDIILVKTKFGFYNIKYTNLQFDVLMDNLIKSNLNNINIIKTMSNSSDLELFYRNDINILNNNIKELINSNDKNLYKLDKLVQYIEFNIDNININNIFNYFNNLLLKNYLLNYIEL